MLTRILHTLCYIFSVVQLKYWMGSSASGILANPMIFNSIYFKTHNIKKQVIQIIISHMVRMKYN